LDSTCCPIAEDVVSLLKRCSQHVQPGGFIMVKENICREGFVVDKDDNSLTRANAYMLELIRQAGLTVRYNVKQRNFPKKLYEVRMYVLQGSTAAAV
jgi:protein N-terminal methyltransferase